MIPQLPLVSAKFQPGSAVVGKRLADLVCSAWGRAATWMALAVSLWLLAGQRSETGAILGRWSYGYLAFAGCHLAVGLLAAFHPWLRCLAVRWRGGIPKLGPAALAVALAWGFAFLAPTKPWARTWDQPLLLMTLAWFLLRLFTELGWVASRAADQDRGPLVSPNLAKVWGGFCLAVPLTMAAWYRWPSFPPTVFWSDEAWRGMAVLSTANLDQLVDFLRHNNRVMLVSEWLLGKAGLAILGVNEWALRAPVYLAALVGTALSYCVLRRFMGRTAAGVGCLLLAMGCSFIALTREFKPYGLDLMFTAAATAAVLLHEKSNSPWSVAVLASALLAFALGSLVSFMVLPGLFAYQIHQRRLDRGAWLAWFIAGSALAANYLFFLLPQGSGHTISYWNYLYINNWRNLSNLVGAGAYLQQYFAFPGPLAVFAIFLGAQVISWRRKDGFWLLALVPFLIACVLSGLGKYPLFERPSYYLYALMAWSLAYALDAAAGGLGRLASGVDPIAWRWLALALGVTMALSGGMAVKADQGRRSPPDYGNQSLAELEREFRQQDQLVLSENAVSCFMFHRASDRARNPELKRAHFLGVRDESLAALCASLERLPGFIDSPPGSRWWFMTAHFAADFPRHKMDYYRSALADKGDFTVRVDTSVAGLAMLHITAEAAICN